MEPNKFFEIVQDYRRDVTLHLTSKMSDLEEILEVNGVRNVLSGLDNADEFYEGLLNYSINNKRNSKEFLKVVKEPIIELLNENRNAKL